MRIWKMGASKKKLQDGRTHCSQRGYEGNAKDAFVGVRCRTPNIRIEDKLRRSGGARSKASNPIERATTQVPAGMRTGGAGRP